MSNTDVIISYIHNFLSNLAFYDKKVQKFHVSTKPNIEVRGWLYQTKIPITIFFIKKNIKVSLLTLWPYKQRDLHVIFCDLFAAD